MGSLPKGISGSRAAAVLGLSEYRSPFSVWQELCEERNPGFNAKRGYLLPENPDNASIRFGLAFEKAISCVVEKHTGLTISDREREFSEDFNTCHVDGMFSDGGMYEGKTTTIYSYWESWGEQGTDRVPQSYQIQAQNNMRLSRAPFARLFVLVFPRRPDEWEKEGITADKIDPLEWAIVIEQMGLLKEYRIEASASLQEMLRDRMADFWATYVLPEVEPPIDCYADMLRAFPAPVGTIVVTEQEAAWLVERKMITEEISDTSPMARRKKALATLTLESIRSRIGAAVMDSESTEKLVFVDSSGKKLGQYAKGIFR